MAERVSATFENEQDAERAVDALIEAGLDAEAVTLVSPTGPEGGRTTSDETVPSEEPHPGETMVGPPTAGAGVATGALLGLGAVNAGAGLGGVGSGATGQPLAAGAGGVVAGVISSALLGPAYEELVDLGLDEDTTRLYERRLQGGSCVVVVHPNGIAPDEARSILETHGGADLRGAVPLIPLV